MLSKQLEAEKRTADQRAQLSRSIASSAVVATRVLGRATVRGWYRAARWQRTSWQLCCARHLKRRSITAWGTVIRQRAVHQKARDVRFAAVEHWMSKSRGLQLRLLLEKWADISRAAVQAARRWSAVTAVCSALVRRGSAQLTLRVLCAWRCCSSICMVRRTIDTCRLRLERRAEAAVVCSASVAAGRLRLAILVVWKARSAQQRLARGLQDLTALRVGGLVSRCLLQRTLILWYSCVRQSGAARLLSRRGEVLAVAKSGFASFASRHLIRIQSVQGRSTFACWAALSRSRSVRCAAVALARGSDRLYSMSFSLRTWRQSAAGERRCGMLVRTAHSLLQRARAQSVVGKALRAWSVSLTLSATDQAQAHVILANTDTQFRLRELSARGGGCVLSAIASRVSAVLIRDAFSTLRSSATRAVLVEKDRAVRDLTADVQRLCAAGEAVAKQNKDLRAKEEAYQSVVGFLKAECTQLAPITARLASPAATPRTGRTSSPTPSATPKSLHRLRTGGTTPQVRRWTQDRPVPQLDFRQHEDVGLK